MNTTQALGLGLIAAGALGAVGLRYFKSAAAWLKRRVTTDDVADPPDEKSSDAPAPAGVSVYLQTVVDASPTATAETRWAYASAGLCEADILREEVRRLSQA